LVIFAISYKELRYKSPARRARLVDTDTSHWTDAELRSALDMFVEGCAGVRKLCLFVDGLDEYSGKYEKLTSLFT
jgi:hypothetical protein